MRRGEEDAAELEQAPCVAVPVQTGEKDLEVHGRDLRPSWSCNSLRPLPLPALFLFLFLFFWKNLASFSLRHKRNALCAL